MFIMRQSRITLYERRIRVAPVDILRKHSLITLLTQQRMRSSSKLSGASLRDVDPEMYGILEREQSRQKRSINLIPSENFTSRAVLEMLGSVMQNKYSEGYPGARYYGGNEHIDQSEQVCQQRALETFGLSTQEWGVNVQLLLSSGPTLKMKVFLALSGSPANLYALLAMLETNERLMGLDLPHGGHLSHGYQLSSKKISMISKYFQTLPYHVNTDTGIIDYDGLQNTASVYRPKVIIAGYSAYSRLLDYARIRQIADSVAAYVLSDMAHIAGLVAAKAIPSPFPYSDVVTTTTHKSLRGPRGAMIFYRKGVRRLSKNGSPVYYDLEGRINASVFPGHQGGPHNHTIAALAVALRQTHDPAYQHYQQLVLANAQALAGRLLGKHGINLVSGGTDNHMLLLDLRSTGIDGAKAERVFELCGVACNKNTVPGDISAMKPSGLRIGTPAMTTVGFTEKDFEKVADIIARCLDITTDIHEKFKSQASSKDSKSIKAFLEYVGNGSAFAEIGALKTEVEHWVEQFPQPWLKLNT